jgi:hypothetical protein
MSPRRVTVKIVHLSPSAPQLRVQSPLVTLTATTIQRDHNPFLSPYKVAAPLPLLPLGRAVDVAVLPPPAAGAVGVNVAPALLRQELTAAFAAATLLGAAGLMVAFPAKLQDSRFRLVVS